MCLNPILRPNVNFGKGHIGINFLKDCDRRYIEVPCGHCPECIAVRQNQLVQRVENESKYSYLFFCTLTYDNKHLPQLSVLVPASTSKDGSGAERTLVPITPDDAESFLENADFDFDQPDTFNRLADDEMVEATELKPIQMPYADIHHIQLLLKNLRDNNPCPGRRLRYVAVSELGKTRARPHFHILFFVEKLPTDDKFTPINLEKPFREYVKAHWAVNVGTRKNPVWEPRFTYRKRFYGGKLYQNFDLHYVNPDLTTGGVQNVAYYVTKYMMKASPKEEARQQFLKLNLQEEQYEKVWSQIKCRLLVSKGLGLDVSFETVEQVQYVPLPLDEYAAVLDADDIPPSDEPACKRVVVKKRVMIPNFTLCSWLHNTMRRGLNDANPTPIYVDLQGNHRPLSRYYLNKSWIYTAADALDFWFNASREQIDNPKKRLYGEEYDRKIREYEKRVDTIDKNGDFDLLSGAMDTFLYDDDPGTPNPVSHRYQHFNNTTSFRLGTDKL